MSTRSGKTSPHTLNVGKCSKCGTYNPTVPGEKQAQKCSGCGHPLWRERQRVTEWDFTPARPPRPRDEE